MGGCAPKTAGVLGGGVKYHCLQGVLACTITRVQNACTHSVLEFLRDILGFSDLSQEIGWEERLQSDLFCVGWDKKTLIQ